LGSFEDLGFGEESWEERRRLEGEKVTVAEILGGGVGGFGREGREVEEGGGKGEGFGGALGFEAKKRDITCCFCLPMTVVVLVVVEAKPKLFREHFLIWRASFWTSFFYFCMGFPRADRCK
jgi:hypothetical protein